MKHLRLLCAACAALLCLSLPSCIDGQEEVWLNGDGSGRADLFYDVPAAAARFQGGEAGIRELLASLLKDTPSHSEEITTTGDRMKVRVKVAFKSPADIQALTSSTAGKKIPASLEHLAGIFQISQKLNNVEFTRTISPGKALPAAFIPPSEFKNRKLTYILHLPVVPAETNATRSSDDGHTLTWEQPLAAAVRQPIIIHFKARFPLPPWLVPSAVALLLALAAAGFLLFRRNKPRSDTA